MKIQFDTTYYKASHGKVPTSKQKGDWTFQPPQRVNPWRFVNCTYKEAKDRLKKAARTNVGDGTYILLP